MALHKFLSASLFVVLVLLSSCMGDDDNDKYRAWRKENIKYVNDMRNLVVDGKPFYTTISPEWAPSDFVLMHWYNDRALTEKNLQPLYNSTCNVTYRLSTIEGPVDSSFNLTTYGDSIFQCKPSKTVVGFSIALTNMHIGDSCRVIIPYFVGYDYSVTSTLKKPYTTLIYDLKLVSIPGYEIPM